MVIGCSVTNPHTKHNTDFCGRANWAVALQRSLVQGTGELHFLVQGLFLMNWRRARYLCRNEWWLLLGGSTRHREREHLESAHNSSICGM